MGKGGFVLYPPINLVKHVKVTYIFAMKFVFGVPVKLDIVESSLQLFAIVMKEKSGHCIGIYLISFCYSYVLDNKLKL